MSFCFSSGNVSDNNHKINLFLFEKLQGEAYEGYERTIDVHIRNLRVKIESDPGHPRYIETVYGVGYRFAQD